MVLNAYSEKYEVLISSHHHHLKQRTERITFMFEYLWAESLWKHIRHLSPLWNNSCERRGTIIFCFWGECLVQADTSQMDMVFLWFIIHVLNIWVSLMFGSLCGRHLLSPLIKRGRDENMNVHHLMKFAFNLEFICKSEKWALTITFPVTAAAQKVAFLCTWEGNQAAAF